MPVWEVDDLRLLLIMLGGMRCVGSDVGRLR